MRQDAFHSRLILHFLFRFAFFDNFTGSVIKTDYLTLRNGFIVAHFSESNFNFQKFLVRAFDDDFVQVVGISFWIWMFSIFFFFISAHGIFNYIWLPFILLLMVLAVGTKFQLVITKFCLESRNKTAVVQGNMLFKPSDDLFWFSRPHWLLHLIHFILFQNSFQLAFFTWTWYEYGLRSCFHQNKVDIVLRIAIGVIVQFLCGYVTLPRYALVTQMGSGMKATVFSERVVEGLKHWHSLSRQNLSRYGIASMRHSSTTFSDHIGKGLKHWQSLAQKSLSRNKYTLNVNLSDVWATHRNEASLYDAQDLSSIENEQLSPLSITCSTTTEITEEIIQSEIIPRGTNDSEISFGTSAEHSQLPPLSITNSASTEVIEEVPQQRIITRRTYDDHFSSGISVEHNKPPLNSGTAKITEEGHHKVVTRGTHDGEIIFGNFTEHNQLPPLPTTKSATRGTYDEIAEGWCN